MKVIAERFPKTWDDFWDFMWNEYQFKFSDFNWLTVLGIFGYLVLEYFPKHGIEIERKIELDKYENDYIKYYVYLKDDISLIPNLKDIFYNTPILAITKAFEIIEKQLDRK